MRYTQLALAMILGLSVTGAASADSPKERPPVLNFTVKANDGTPVDLGKYRGQVLILVNTASKCGLTPQYADLEQLYKQHKERGLRILAFPANDFGQQEPGTDSEIRQFCSANYNVSFDLFSKVTVVGAEKAPLYRYLTEQTEPSLRGDIKWNFTKFLVNRKGEVVARFEPKVKPDSPEFRAALEKLLAEPAS
jgi:glutathione peroxidase